MTLDDWLDDLCVRFINNLPQADLTSMARICFQVEEAHWFYDDFIRPLDRSLPAMTLRTFCLSIFKRCPLLAPFPIEHHVLAFEQFLKYKTSIPVRGAILLNETMDMALLVKGWKKGANWSFPKGKINMDEDDLDCAVREVDEETGFDIRSAGLVPPPEEVKFIDTSFRDQQIRLYVFRNVPMDTHFEPKTRKEIGGIQWYKIADLPSYRKKNNANGHETDEPTSATSNRFYMVAPFIGPLRKWIAFQRKRDAARAAGNNYPTPQMAHAEDTYTEDEGNALPEPVTQDTLSGIADPNQILENANRELRQMLRMPPLPSDEAPPVQAPAPVHPPPVQDAFVDPNQNKANALLAVLKQGGTIKAPPPPAPAPAPGGGQGISLNHLLSQVSQPQSNAPRAQHHQQYEHQLPPYSHQQQQQHQYQQPPPQHQIPQLGPPPQNQHLQQRFELQKPQQGQQHQQSSQNYPYPQQPPQQSQNMNPFAPNPQVPPPPPYTVNGNDMQGPAQAFAQAQAAAAAFRSPQHAPPPIPLLHPQPLPPVVQKALFARDMLASPDASSQQGNSMLLPPPPPPQQQQYRGQQAPLSNHAAALLNAFKKDDSATRPGGASGAPPLETAGGPGWPQQKPQQLPQQQQQQQQQQARHASHAVPQQQTQQPQQPYATLQHNLHGARPQPASQHPYGSLQAGAVPAAQNPNQGAPNLPSGNNDNFNQYLPRPAAANNGPQDQPPVRTEHSDQHRSSLLSMFTKQTTQPVPQAAAPIHVPASGSPASAPAPPQHATLGHNARTRQSAGGPQGVTAQRTVYSATTISTTQSQQGASLGQGQGQSQAQAIEAAARANGGPIEMNAQTNLPFGALTLLTRPKAQQNSSPSHSGVNAHATRTDRSQQHPSTFASPITELPAETTQLRKQPSLPRQVSQPYSTSPSDRRPSTRGSQPPYNTAAATLAVAATLPPHGTAVRRPSHASSSPTAPAPGDQYQPPQPHPLPTLNYPSTSAATGGASVRAPEPANPEHKQKLLSLFAAKQPPPPPQPPAMSTTSAASIAGAGLHPIGMHAPQHLPPPQPHAQQQHAPFGPYEAADSAPAIEANNSRRGSSQAPISPANRNFLLGYLASVSGTQ
ncbi:hypothetical protein SPBR_04054 [Sporothrix brasiliensis 5110]|uniref:Nudix hydrolase domain-containing protein n=1 Tax=Sporothrix brasiliensis 5110 TaxID=1398154 RepID=A0A0C2J3Y6_9PEZI|nr:uncharacterized protein SPBR_04054 [Sporothrix brasiliensis 5110]KIH93700.1 hypothetical protein SPBR_04054 [Sporothrix brasiliensis 5110]